MRPFKYPDIRIPTVSTFLLTCQNDETESQISSQIGCPDREERISQLHAPLAHVKDKQAQTSEQNDGQFFPVCNQPGFLSGGTVLVDHVLAGEDQPEHHQCGVKDPLK